MESQIKEYIEQWIQKVSEKQEKIGNFPICPFANNSNYTIIECSISKIIPIQGYDVIIYIVEQELTQEQLINWVEIYNNKYPEWKFFEDCYTRNTYIQGIKTNNDNYMLIIAQPKQKLKEYRQKLAKTDYYHYWEEEYLKEILEEDIEIISKG